MKKCINCGNQFESDLTLCPNCGVGGNNKSMSNQIIKFGDDLSNLGKKLTIGLTIPILLTFLFGIVGFVIGLLIFIATFFCN